MQLNRKKIKAILALIVCWTINPVYSQEHNAIDEMVPTPLDYIRGKDSLVDHVLNNPQTYHFQWMLTEVKKVDSNYVLGQTYDFSEPAWYFYPASIVKLPLAILTLEKLKKTGFSTHAQLRFNRDQECGNMSYVDASIDPSLTIGDMLKKLIIVSNNTYYNSFFHYLTPKLLNEELNRRGFGQTKIYKDFTGCEMPLNLFSNSLNVSEQVAGNTFVQRSSVLELKDFANHYTYDRNKLIGSKHEYRGKIVDGPFDFNYNLEYPIRDIHVTSLRLFFPDYFPKEVQWDIRERDRNLLLESMKSYPKDLGDKEFLNEKDYPNNLYKYIALGTPDSLYSSVITYSKIGISYGFVSETAYVIDQRTDKRYVLTANIYVNSNNTVNDGKYEYEEVARPFLSRFGQLLLED